MIRGGWQRLPIWLSFPMARLTPITSTWLSFRRTSPRKTGPGLQPHGNGVTDLRKGSRTIPLDCCGLYRMTRNFRDSSGRNAGNGDCHPLSIRIMRISLARYMSGKAGEWRGCISLRQTMPSQCLKDKGLLYIRQALLPATMRLILMPVSREKPAVSTLTGSSDMKVCLIPYLWV